jgi:hypothetical protein
MGNYYLQIVSLVIILCYSVLPSPTGDESRNKRTDFTNNNFGPNQGQNFVNNNNNGRPNSFFNNNNNNNNDFFWNNNNNNNNNIGINSIITRNGPFGFGTHFTTNGNSYYINHTTSIIYQIDMNTGKFFELRPVVVDNSHLLKNGTIIAESSKNETKTTEQ